jgi:hypothetical protein
MRMSRREGKKEEEEDPSESLVALRFLRIR